MQDASPPRPSPASCVLDHVVVNARDRLDEAAQAYRHLGFHLTELSRHTLGSMNRLAIFATDYLEIVAVDPMAAAPRAELLRDPAGLNGLVFATEDAAALHERLVARAAPVEPPAEFSRPVTLREGAADARFRVVRVSSSVVPYGRVYFCQHLTRPLVWRDEWRRHPNGAVAIARVVIATPRPDATAALYRKLFGDDAVCAIAGGARLKAGLACVDFQTPMRVADEFGVPVHDREHMAGLTLRTLSLAGTGDALAAGGVDGVRRDGARLLVPPAAAFGLTIEFVE